jgi:hypothetical protein
MASNILFTHSFNSLTSQNSAKILATLGFLAYLLCSILFIFTKEGRGQEFDISNLSV